MNQKIFLDVSKWCKDPYQMVSIKWEVDNASGSTETEAWQAQAQIEKLEKAGYRIISVEPFH